MLQQGVRGLQVFSVCVRSSGGVSGSESAARGMGLEVFFMSRLHYWGRGNGVCAPFRLSLASKPLGGGRTPKRAPASHDLAPQLQGQKKMKRQRDEDFQWEAAPDRL